MTLTLYTTPGCGACTATKSAMRRRDVDFTEVDLATDRQAVRLVRDRLGHTHAPVTVHTDPTSGQILDHWSGLRLDRLTQATAAPSPAAPWPQNARRLRPRRPQAEPDADPDVLHLTRAALAPVLDSGPDVA